MRGNTSLSAKNLYISPLIAKTSNGFLHFTEMILQQKCIVEKVSLCFSA